MSEEKNKSEEVSGNLKEENRIAEMERTLRIAKCLQGEPVCVINDRQAPHKGMKAAKDWANGIFDGWGNKVISPELGEIVVNVHSVNDTLAHGLSPFKIEAIRSIKDVIEQGVVFAQTRVEDRDHYFIAAPIILENQVDIVSVLVHKDMNTQRMYLHSVMIREKILKKNFEQKNTPEHLVRSADSRELSEPNRKLYSGDIGRILQKFLKVNIHQLEIELNQQIEQEKGNKMDTREQLDMQFVQNTLAQYPLKDGEPYLVIDWSENAVLSDFSLEDGNQTKFSVSAADKIFTYFDDLTYSERKATGELDLDYEYDENNYRGYDKTKYAIYQADGEVLTDNLRYDIGDNNGGLFCELSSEKEKHEDLLNLTQYISQDERLGLLDRIDKQMEVDNNYAMRYPEVKEARMATMSNRGAFFERLQQQILQQDKTVEQHLSEMVDEVVAIANRQNVEQRQPENEERQNAVQTQELSGNLKAESTPLDALQALGKVEFITPALNKEQDALNETLQGLTAEQRKAVEPLYKQLEASHELRQMYQEYGDTIGVEDIEKHINRIEWAFRNKVKAFNEPQVDYSYMNYYKGVENTINKMREENEQRQPETISGSPNQDSSPQVMNDSNLSGNPEPKTETQPQIDEPKNFVQNFIENQLNAQNSQEVVTDSNISDAKTFQEKVMFARVAETEISKMIDDIAKQRLYLAVDFDNKDTAKAAGAKWDKALKGWYAEKGNLNDELQAFLPQQPVTTVENRKPYSDLMAEAQKIGVELNSVNFKEDFHTWVRCPIKGKGKNNRDGGYKLFRNDDGSIGATVKNYSSGDSVNWCDKTLGDREVKSKVPLPDFVANKKQEEWNEVAKNTVEHDIQQMRSKIAEQAYHSLQPALSTDPYIQKKGIVDIGKLRRLDDGSTIVPLFHNGKIANLQMIRASDNEKRMMTQAVKVGAYYSIGNGKNPQTVIIAEGMATADSVHQIASEIYGKDKVLTLAAIDSGNLKAVADKVDKVYPDAQKLIAADNDLGNELKAQQRGVDSAETHKYNAGFKYANQVIEVYPHFKAIPAPAFDGKNTDWNDVLTAKGFDTSIKLFQESIDRQPANVKQQAATPQMTPQRKNGTDGRER